MLRQHHFYGGNHLHYLTSSTYRRARLFDSERFKGQFVGTLDDLRTEFDFRIIGYVLMPEHFHLSCSGRLTRRTLPRFYRSLKSGPRSSF